MNDAMILFMNNDDALDIVPKFVRLTDDKIRQESDFSNREEYLSWLLLNFEHESDDNYRPVALAVQGTDSEGS